MTAGLLTGRAAGFVLLTILSIDGLTVALAQTPATDTESGYSRRGADTCLACHDTGADSPVLAIFSTPHGSRDDPRGPFAQLQCETCHGPGAAHAQRVRRGEPQASIRTFGPQSGTPTEEQDAACLDCHASDAGLAWHASTHAFNDVGCASCHTIHTPSDAVLERAQQPAVCYDCHQRQRMQSTMAFTHPIRYEQMACSQCHAPHGGAGEYALARVTVNDTCFACHAEKRGPFLWEHAPASEDCSLCHTAHGSMHPALLRQRPPLLCQQCHSQAGHPSVANTPATLPPFGASPMSLAGSCLNCHISVHGSNHPSGSTLTR